jgi:hypothetical protein
MDASGVEPPANAYATAVHAALAAKEHGKMLQVRGGCACGYVDVGMWMGSRLFLTYSPPLASDLPLLPPKSINQSTNQPINPSNPPNQVLDAMLSRNVEVEERLLDTIMADLVKGGRWEEGRAILHSLQTAGRVSGPEALGRVYTRVLEACVPEGQWQESFRLLEEMEAAGLLLLPPPAPIPAFTHDPSPTAAAAPPPSAAATPPPSQPQAAGGGGGGAGAGDATLANGNNNISGASSSSSSSSSSSVAEAAYRAAMGACRRAGAVEGGVFALLDHVTDAGAALGGDQRQQSQQHSQQQTLWMELYSLAFATCFEKVRRCYCWLRVWVLGQTKQNKH